MGLLDKIKEGAGDAGGAVAGASAGAVDTATDAGGTAVDVTTSAPGNLADAATSTSLSDVDSAVEGGAGAVFDNDVFSIQNTVSGAAQRSFQAGQLLSGQDPDASREDVAEAFQGAVEGTGQTVDDAVDGTPFDNQATDVAAFAGNALVGQPARTVFGTLTGIDPATGETDYRPGALEAAEIGLIAGTGGLGRAATGSGRLASRLGLGSSDEAAEVAGRAASDSGGLLSRLRGGDEAASATTRSGDEAAETVTRIPDEDVTRLGRGDSPFASSDEATDAFNIAGRSTDDAASTAVRSSDDATSAAARTSDESATAVTRPTDESSTAIRTADDTAAAGRNPSDTGGLLSRIRQVSDETAGTAGRSVDDVGTSAARSTDDVASAAGRSSDDAISTSARVVDDGASAADDSAGLFGRLGSRVSRSGDDSAGLLGRLGSRLGGDGPGLFSRITGISGRSAAIGTGGLLAGGALTTIGLNGLTNPPEQVEATVDGVPYTFNLAQRLEPTEEFPQGGAIYNVTEDFQTVGYWVLIGVRGRNLILLDEDRNTRKAKISAEAFQELQPSQQNGGNE